MFEFACDILETPRHQRLGDGEDIDVEAGRECLDDQVVAVEQHPLVSGVATRDLAEALHQRVLTTRNAFHPE